MSVKMTKRGALDNEITYEFMCDTISDLNAIEPRYVTMGSTAIVIKGEVGFEVYIANSQKQWVSLGSGGSSSDNNTQNNTIKIIFPSNLLDTAYDSPYYYRNLQLNGNVLSGEIRDLNSSGYICIYVFYNNQTISLYDYYHFANSNNEQYYSAYYPILEYDDGSVAISMSNYLDYENNDLYGLALYANGEGKLPSKLKFIFLTEQDATVINSYLAQNDYESGNELIANKEVLGEFDLSQLTYVPDDEWDQAGE